MKESDNLIAVLAEADRQIAALQPNDLAGLGRALHDAASHIAPADAFYACTYSEANQLFRFIYNFDGRIFDDPVPLPLGTGPTSWAVRHKQPFILNEQTRAIQHAGVSFGDVERATLSAVHVPMRVLTGNNMLRVAGVFSAQSYEQNAYGLDEIAAFQWLADHTGLILRLWDPGRDSPFGGQEQVPEADGMTVPAATMAETFAKMTKRISQRADAVQRLLPGEGGALRTAIDLLRHECHLVQTEAARFYPPAPVPADQDAIHPLESVMNFEGSAGVFPACVPASLTRAMSRMTSGRLLPPT